MRALRLALGIALGGIAAAVVDTLRSAPPVEVLRQVALAVLVAVAIRWIGRGGQARTQPSERAFLALLVTLAAGVRIAWVAAVPNRLVSDFAIYHELAVALVSGQGYTLTGPIGQEDLELYLGTDKALPYVTAYRAPGMPLFAALLYGLFGVRPVLLKVASVVLGTATALLLYGLLARAGRPGAGRIAGLVWALFPSAVFASNLFGSEVPFTFALVAAAALAELPLASGIASGIACLFRPMWLPIGLAGGLARRRQPGAIVLFLAGTALAIAPWTARNARTFHRFIPICTSDGEFAARHSAYSMPEALRASPRFAERWHEWTAITGEIERSRSGHAVALANLGDILAAGPAAVLGAVRTAMRASFGDDDQMLLWSVTGAYGLATSPGPALVLPAAWIDFWVALARAAYLGLVIAALIALWSPDALAAARSPGVQFLLLYFLATFPFHAVLAGPNRYHFALMPVVALVAALGAGREAAGGGPAAPGESGEARSSSVGAKAG